MPRRIRYCWCWLWLLLLSTPQSLNAAEWVQGNALTQALQQPVVASWQNAELQSVLESLAGEHRVAVIRDRRLDPAQSITLSSTGIPLQDVYLQLADSAGGQVTRFDTGIYIGPTSAAERLRTIIALRAKDWQTLVQQSPANLRSPRQASQAIQWPEVTEPRQFLLDWTNQRKLTLRGAELIPHDLWEAGEWPAMPPALFVSLWLIQFDLTFEVDAARGELQIVPIPTDLGLERTYTLPRPAILDRISERKWGTLVTKTQNRQLIARGRIEELEELESLLAGTTAQTQTPKTTASASLQKRKITFQATGVPLSAILEKLSETGLEFETSALKEAGFDPSRKLITIDVQQVPMTEFLERLCEQAELDLKLGDGLRVTLKPRS